MLLGNILGTYAELNWESPVGRFHPPFFAAGLLGVGSSSSAGEEARFFTAVVFLTGAGLGLGASSSSSSSTGEEARFFGGAAFFGGGFETATGFSTTGGLMSSINSFSVLVFNLSFLMAWSLDSLTFLPTTINEVVEPGCFSTSL